MRNLKRALSLALASVMLLGMMVVGTSAASINDFTDVDEINNKEAVAIATGLGIFDGYTDGSFGPEKAVTRAEAAVVIAKILHGSDVNPSNLAGAGKFTDVPAWAEGYVNLVAALKIIEGRGNGIFDPNATVTTVEFTTMLLKALGYYVDAETALNADWKLEVTSKANALGLYGDLELGMNAPLSREDVAALTFNALFAQRVAYNDYRGQYVKATDRDVVVTNGTVDALNTLADNTFGLYSVEGIVTANGYTNESLSESLKSEAQTTVMFTEETDLNQDGKAEYAEGEDYDFEVETGLDMIGHAATVYYTIEKKAPVVFAIVDEATLVATISYNTNTARLADAANDAGFKKNTVLDILEKDYIVNYDFETSVEDAIAAGAQWANGNAVALNSGKLAENIGNTTSTVSKDLIVISNSGNLTVDYVIVLDRALDTVNTIDNDEEFTEYDLTLTGTDVVALEEVAEDDYVMVTNIGLKDAYYAFELAEVVEADITKLTGRTNATSDITKVTADGEDYTKSKVFVDTTATTGLDELVAFSAITKIGTATMILDDFGKLIAIEGTKEVPNYAYVAEYGIRHSTSGLNTKDVLTAKVYFADGTSGVYEVDVADSDALVYQNGVELDNATVQNFPNDVKKALNGSALKPATIVDKTTQGTISTWSNKLLAARGLYDVNVQSDDTITIDVITTDVSADVVADDIKLVKSHSTLLDVSNSAAIVNVETSAVKYDSNGDKTGDTNCVLYNNNDTVYFYIDCDAKGDNLIVKVITGIKNAKGFTNGANEYNTAKAADTGIQEAFASAAGKRAVVDTMLITCVDLGDASNVYYHDVEDYYVTEAEAGKYTVTYKVYDNETGAASEVTYDNNGKYWSTVKAAKDHAMNNFDGWYTLGANDLVIYAAESNANDVFAMETKGTTTYITNDDANYDEYVDNLFGDQSKLGAILDMDTVKVVDICDSKLTTVSKLVNAIEDDGDVDISFTWNADYETFVIFVTAYNPDSATAPNAGAVDTSITKVILSTSGNVQIGMATGVNNGEKLNVTLYRYTDARGWDVVATRTATVDNADWNAAGADSMEIDGYWMSELNAEKFALTKGEQYKVVVNGVESIEIVK